MPDRDDKSRHLPSDEAAMDSVAQLAEWARKYQNHIVVAVCLVVLVVFGKRWYDAQKASREASGWNALSTAVSVDQLQKASEQYADTPAGSFLRFEYGHALEEADKVAEAKQVYEELQKGSQAEGLAANLARSRLTDLKEDDKFAKLLPGKLAELAKNAPPPPVQEDVAPEFGPSRRYMAPTDSKPTPVPAGLQPLPAPPNPLKEAFGPPREMMAAQEPPKEPPK